MKLLRQLAWDTRLGRAVTLVSACLAGAWAGSGFRFWSQFDLAVFVAAVAYFTSIRSAPPRGLHG
jgi:hypothetical protein